MCRIFNRFKIVVFLITLSWVFTGVSYAADCSTPVDPTRYSLVDLHCPIEKGLEVLIYSSGAVFLGIIFYSAIKYSLSQGDPKGIQGAQQTLTWSVVGFLIVVFVVAIANIIANIFGASLSTTLAGIITDVLTWVYDNQITY